MVSFWSNSREKNALQPFPNRAELTKRVTKAEEASAEAQRAAAEAKRSGKPTAKTCYWCGEEGHVKPDCPVFLAGEPKVKKGN